MKNYRVAALMQLVDARKIDHGVSGEMISSDGSEEKAFHIISCPDGGASKMNPPRKPPPKPKTGGSQNVSLDIHLLPGVELKVRSEKLS
ncbi:unnamed protein product [Sphagnum jensenii]|uniref:Uncharacterized protein n=1 Tax=Sphagnum jensenii TaxID=128206 RepID=A0ABP1AID1_9BRYO